MVKYIILIAVLLMPVACLEDKNNNPMSTEFYPTTLCLNGVEYWMIKHRPATTAGFGFMAPKYNKDGSIALCTPTTVTYGS
jgi:hypothetical protein